MASTIMVTLAAAAVGSAGFATNAGAAFTNQGEQSKVCKTVVGAERGAKPYELCMTSAQWKAKKVADSKDANRIVCRYQEQLGSRFRSYKVCMPAAEWDNQRLRERQAIDQIQMRSCVRGGGC